MRTFEKIKKKIRRINEEIRQNLFEKNNIQNDLGY